MRNIKYIGKIWKNWIYKLKNELRGNVVLIAKDRNKKYVKSGLKRYKRRKKGVNRENDK